MTSRDQGLYSNDQGRKRRETLGTRLVAAITIIDIVLSGPVPSNCFALLQSPEEYNNSCHSFSLSFFLSAVKIMLYTYIKIIAIILHKRLQ